LQVLYNAKGDFNVIDFTEEVDGTKIFNKKLDELGFVTSSCILFTTDTKVAPKTIIPEKMKEVIY